MQAHDHLFWELLEDERHHLWRLCRALTRNYDDAQDLMSDTMLSAYQSFPGLRDPKAFRKFLSTIAVRIHRRRQWRNRLFAPLESAADMYYENSRESAYDIDMLVRALGRLPVKEREALVLFELSGLSIREIQEIQGGTESGVKSRMSRARAKLKDLLVDRGYAPEKIRGHVVQSELAQALRWQEA